MNEGGKERARDGEEQGRRGSERWEAGQVVCCVCVWVGETRLRGACGGVGYVYVCVHACVRVTVEAEEEPGVGPHTYTLASSQALCVCVLFMPLRRHCAVWNKGPIWAVLPPEAARLAATADQSLRLTSNRHTSTLFIKSSSASVKRDFREV